MRLSLKEDVGDDQTQSALRDVPFCGECVTPGGRQCVTNASQTPPHRPAPPPRAPVVERGCGAMRSQSIAVN